MKRYIVIMASIVLTSSTASGNATVTAQATAVGNTISGATNVAFMRPLSNPRREKGYLVYASLRPLAEPNIKGATTLKEKAESLVKNAEERGLDVAQCQSFYTMGIEYLEEARSLLDGDNAVAANTFALMAQRESRKALECLALLLENASFPEA